MKDITLLGYGHTTCNETWGIQAESAEFCRVYFVLDGICRYEDAVNDFVLKQGHLYFLPQYTSYSLSQDLAHPFFVLWQHVQLPGFCVRKIVDAEIGADSARWHILRALEDMTRGALIEKITDEPQGLQAQIASLLAVLVSIVERDDEEPFTPLDDHLSRIWELMDTPEFGSLTVQKMASIANLERSYFSRMFHQQLGISPQQWLLRTRMAQAAHLLLEGKTVADTAGMVGYADEKAFARAFSQVMRKPPSQYRKSHIMQP